MLPEKGLGMGRQVKAHICDTANIIYKDKTDEEGSCYSYYDSLQASYATGGIHFMMEETPWEHTTDNSAEEALE